jgi:hypothetical protein
MYKKFRIGDVVKVTKIVYIEKFNDKRILLEEDHSEKPYYMYYVGYTNLRTGTIVETKYADEQNYFTNIKSHKVAKLVFSQNGKIHYAPFDSIEQEYFVAYTGYKSENQFLVAEHIFKHHRPESFVNYGGWKNMTEQEKKNYKQDVKDWKCKLCGRFVSIRNSCSKCGDLNASNT